MQKISFSEGWEYRRLQEQTWQAISLPHDAMLQEKRISESAGGTNTGWYEGYDYEYRKTFFVPAEYKDKELFFEFEGVYHNAEVFLNGVQVAFRPYGYTNFYVPAQGLVYGAENEICVIARNADQPNSRWYSGAGIYRPVWLYVAEPKHVVRNGIKIRTLSLSPAVVQVVVRTTDKGEVCVLLAGQEQSVYTEGEATLTFTLDNARLWTPETPELYTCKVRFERDEEEVEFGIRTIACNADEGFLLNGKRVILRGACIHHDNGILGACCYAEAEERKIRILKENGYNAVRSAHNPCSKALLDACDRLGMLMMDEYCDMWYIHKTMYDYASYTEQWYERDITDMVEKDYNHPCVVLYSLGNEVAETGEKRGIDFFRKMQEVCHRLDAEKPVTTGVNIFFNYLYALGFGQYSDEKAKKNPEKKVGSEFFNNLAGLFGDRFMKTMAMLPGCDRKTKECFAVMDVAGYNYGINRYRGDVKKYPDRVILGSETFCADAYAFWEFAKKEPAVIGDFVWAGMDYLGEVGVGSWEYREYAPDFLHGVGWVSAGSGRIDLIGRPLGEALYTKVAFELTEQPQIAVVPVSHTDEKHSPSAWKFSNAIPSWSWNGLDGKKARVEVYSRAPVVELLVNGKTVGKKKFKKNCRFDFRVNYYGGEITAVARDRSGNELSRNSLRTAGERTVLSVQPEKSVAKKGEVCFVPLRYTDEAGTLKPLERHNLTVQVRGGKLLAVGNACPFRALGYGKDCTDTYYGEAMAVVQTDKDTVITVSDGALTGSAKITVGEEEV